MPHVGDSWPPALLCIDITQICLLSLEPQYFGFRHTWRQVCAVAPTSEVRQTADGTSRVFGGLAQFGGQIASVARPGPRQALSASAARLT
jgi:hypothetical protein